MPRPFHGYLCHSVSIPSPEIKHLLDSDALRKKLGCKCPRPGRNEKRRAMPGLRIDEYLRCP